MKLLILVFLLMALFGVVTAHLGGALLALGMAGFVQFARGFFARQDAAHAAMPKHATVGADTREDLLKYDCECSGDRF